MPDRKDTHHIQIVDSGPYLAEIGQSRITDLQARPAEKWLESLPLAPKSRVHIRGILSSLWNFAMWKQAISMQVNPIESGHGQGCVQAGEQPRSLTVDEFQNCAQNCTSHAGRLPWCAFVSACAFRSASHFTKLWFLQRTA